MLFFSLAAGDNEGGEGGVELGGSLDSLVTLTGSLASRVSVLPQHRQSPAPQSVSPTVLPATVSVSASEPMSVPASAPVTAQGPLSAPAGPATALSNPRARPGLAGKRNIKLNIDIEKCEETLDSSNASEVGAVSIMYIPLNIIYSTAAGPCDPAAGGG